MPDCSSAAKRRLRHILLTSVLISLFPVVMSARADGWTQPKGVGFYQVRLELLRTRSYFEPNGNRLTVPTIASYRTSFYGEYGVTNRVTAIAYLPFERLTLNRQVGRVSGVEIDGGDAVTGLADAVLGIRGLLYSAGRTVVSASLSAGVPLGEAEQSSGLYTGDGEFNQQLAVELGQGFSKAGYVVASLGYNNRTQGFSDELAYRLEVGSPLVGPVSGALRVGGVEPMRNGDAVLAGRGLRGNDQRMTRYGAELRLAISPVAGIALSAERATRVQNGLGGTVFGTALFVRM